MVDIPVQQVVNMGIGVVGKSRLAGVWVRVISLARDFGVCTVDYGSLPIVGIWHLLESIPTGAFLPSKSFFYALPTLRISGWPICPLRQRIVLIGLPPHFILRQHLCCRVPAGHVEIRQSWHGHRHRVSTDAVSSLPMYLRLVSYLNEIKRLPSKFNRL